MSMCTILINTSGDFVLQLHISLNNTLTEIHSYVIHSTLLTSLTTAAHSLPGSFLGQHILVLSDHYFLMKINGNLTINIRYINSEWMIYQSSHSGDGSMLEHACLALGLLGTVKQLSSANTNLLKSHQVTTEQTFHNSFPYKPLTPTLFKTKKLHGQEMPCDSIQWHCCALAIRSDE